MKVSISKLKANPRNPRVIRDEKFEKLKKSLQEFPDMLEKRPLVVYTDKDGKYVVLGGNMRLKAAKDIGLAEMPIIIADDWTEEQKAEFLIKDNVGFGEWNHEDLANEWDELKLEEWGLDLPINADVDIEQSEPEFEDKASITLQYTQAECTTVKLQLLKIAPTPEQAVWQLLGNGK